MFAKSKHILLLLVVIITFAFASESELQFIVRGNSMFPILQDGDEVTISEKFYLDNSPKRNEIVIHQFSDQKAPIIKTIKAIESDTLEIELTGGKFAHIVVNGKRLRNSAGELYLIDKDAVRILTLYITDYNSIIPKNTVLLLGETQKGSFDSTRIGLTSVKDILGKVIKINGEMIIYDEK